MSENVEMSVEEVKNNLKEEQQQQQIRLVDVNIDSENTALNVIVSFLAVAQGKGVFNLEESAKIWECINRFKKSTPPP